MRSADLKVDVAPDESAEEVAARIALCLGRGAHVQYLILSDMHGNAEALQAVLRRVRRKRFDVVLVLGDLVGYGAGPNQVVEAVRELAGTVCPRFAAITTRSSPGSRTAPTSITPRWPRRAGRPTT